MTDVRYQIPGVPPEAAKGITAFSPHFNRHAGSSAQEFKYAVEGYPGTRGIPVPARRETQISPDYGDLSTAGTSRSSDAPDAIYPNLYYQSFIAEHPGGNSPQIRMYDPVNPGLTTLLPVPAEDGRGTYTAQSARLTRRAILNRFRPTPNPSPRNYRPGSGMWNG